MSAVRLQAFGINTEKEFPQLYRGGHNQVFVLPLDAMQLLGTPEIWNISSEKHFSIFLLPRIADEIKHVVKFFLPIRQEARVLCYLKI